MVWFLVDFLAKDALLFTLDLQSCFIYSLHCSTCDSNDNIYPKAKTKAQTKAQCGFISQLFYFSLIVEDHRLWFTHSFIIVGKKNFFIGVTVNIKIFNKFYAIEIFV